MRIWFDTEFVDTGDRIILISIGLVREIDECWLYAEVESPETLAQYPVSDWVKQNVYPYLDGDVQPRSVVAERIRNYVGVRPEFWAYVADYDWVALSQLYGPLVNRPKTWPWTALDTYQLPDFKDYVVKPIRPHNALADAQALKVSHLAYERGIR